jgi:tRNA threonylcarbamoyladenosine biosynthesis protein TsaB
VILALNTATPWLSLALLREGQLLAENVQYVDNAHSEAVFVMLEGLFSSLGLTPRVLQAVAVATGPGGFTGVRTGLAVAKTVAQMLNIPVVGIPTLEALAFQCGAAGWVAPMLDARRGLVFASLYRGGPQGLSLQIPPALHPFAEWQAVVRARVGAEPVVWGGEGAMVHRAALASGGAAEVVPPDALLVARAVAVGLLGEARLAAGAASDALTLAPEYLREPQAVVNWEQQQAAV